MGIFSRDAWRWRHVVATSVFLQEANAHIDGAILRTKVALSVQLGPELCSGLTFRLAFLTSICAAFPVITVEPCGILF